MDSLQRAKVSVLIADDNLVPSEVTALLGRPPRRGISKGETFLASHGKQMKAQTGMWYFGGEWESPPQLDRQISDVLSALTSDLSVWAELTNRFLCYLSVGGYFHEWTGGMTIGPKTSKLLAERNLAIDFDLYAPAASE